MFDVVYAQQLGGSCQYSQHWILLHLYGVSGIWMVCIKKWSCIIQCKSAPQIKPRRYSHSLRTNHKGHVHVYNKQWIWNCWGNLGNWLFSSVCFFDFWLWPFSHIFHTIYSILELEPSILHDMCIVCNVLELESIRHAFCKLLLVVGCWLLVVGCWLLSTSCGFLFVLLLLLQLELL